MIQFTDSPITASVTGADFTSAQEIHVSFRQGSTLVDVTDAQVLSATDLQFQLTQEQTGRLRDDKPVQVQVNFIDANGDRKASSIATVEVGTNLLKRILRNG